MYRSSYDEMEETRFFKKLFLWIILILSVVSVGGWLLTRIPSTASTALLRYEEFQEIYNTCQKINTDLGTIRAVDEGDRMFDSFSKAAMIAQKKQQLARWVEEYNGKSRMWNRALWKSSSLPYDLNVNMFPNFQETR